MAGHRTLSKSTRLLRARRFAEVISLLEPQVFLFRENFTFYYTLGVACLYTGDFGGAYSYLQRARQLNPHSIPVLLGLAAVHLRRRQVTEALQHWLQVLDSDPRNRVARRGLAIVRSTEDPSVYVTMAESGRLRRYYPHVGFRLPPAVVVALLVAAAATAFIVAWPAIQPTVAGALDRRTTGTREGTELTVLGPDSPGLTSFEGTFRYVLTEQDVARTFTRIGELFNEFRDNLAMREVNRLLNSTASDLVKERARLLSSYFREPTFVDFRDNFSFAEVAAEPWLYDGCYVRWSGQATNITTTSEAITFTLLVGYEDERVLEGTVPVSVPFAADVQVGPIEVIARVSSTDAGISLTATSIRRLAPVGSR